MLQYELVLQELPADFPRAIRRVMLTPFPDQRSTHMGLLSDGGVLGLASRELLFLTAILRQRRNTMTMELYRRYPDKNRPDGPTGAIVAETFVGRAIHFLDHVADSEQSVVEDVTRALREDVYRPE
jgi:hypothetical protein